MRSTVDLGRLASVRWVGRIARFSFFGAFGWVLASWCEAWNRQNPKTVEKAAPMSTRILSRQILVPGRSLSALNAVRPRVGSFSELSYGRYIHSSRSSRSPGPKATPSPKPSQSQKSSDHEGHERVLYERRPDWYIRLIPLLIVLDLGMLSVGLCQRFRARI